MCTFTHARSHEYLMSSRLLTHSYLIILVSFMRPCLFTFMIQLTVSDNSFNFQTYMAVTSLHYEPREMRRCISLPI